MKYRSRIWLLMLVSMTAMLSTNPASAACQEFKNTPTVYKRCLAYQRMAGTPRQREDAADQYRKDRARKNCRYVGKNPLKVCDDYVTRSEREREAARQRANKGLDSEPLTPIVNRNSGAFGPSSEPSRGRQWRRRAN